MARGLQLPTLQSLGLGCIPPHLPTPEAIPGVAEVAQPKGAYGAMIEQSEGKDTITGHWELGGLLMRPGFQRFPPGPPSFPPEIIEPFTEQTGRGVLGNCHASGTAIIEERGPEHLKTGKWILYTSADSVFQLAAHLDVVSLDELYEACQTARSLCNPYRVGRVIARPFVGEPGSFERTPNRKDFPFEPSEPTVLERLYQADVPVHAVGKIADIFGHRGIHHSHPGAHNPDAQAALDDLVDSVSDGVIMANFIDFDMIHGHRRDPDGYAECLEQTDEWLAGFLPKLRGDDLLLITADHGNDPTFKGTDHTREIVPLLAIGHGVSPGLLGVRHGFFDVAQSLAVRHDLDPMPRGRAFL